MRKRLPASVGAALVLLWSPALMSSPGGCRNAVHELGEEGVGSVQAADALFGAVASRFGPIELDPKLRAARPKFARDSLAPSRLIDDTTLWTRRDGARRILEFGAFPGLPYRLGVRYGPPPPVEAGEYRGSLELRRLGDGDFEWRGGDELGVGPVGVDRIALAGTALIQACQGRAPSELRQLARDTFPRATIAFGRLFAMERLVLDPAPEGGTAVTVVVRIDPSRIRAAFPRYARFIDEYFVRMRYRLTVSAADGSVFWDLVTAENVITLRLRLNDGALAPLEGRPRALPDQLRASLDFSTKAGLMRVGFERLVADVEMRKDAGDRGFLARFVQEPDWSLPFLVKPLVQASLRRPFTGEGAALGFAVREASPGCTVLANEFRLAVRESWIVKWLGSFGGEMVTVFRATAEGEADRFRGECLWALRDDLVALAGS